jgi:hypothetical protein
MYIVIFLSLASQKHLGRLLLLGYQPVQFFSTKSDASLVLEIMGNDRHEQSANAILPFKHEFWLKMAGFFGNFSWNVKKGGPKSPPFFIEVYRGAIKE